MEKQDLLRLFQEGGREVKVSDGREEFKYIWHNLRTFVIATMYLQHNSKKHLKKQKDKSTKFISVLYEKS
jgi:hypothetical protein